MNGRLHVSSTSSPGLRCSSSRSSCFSRLTRAMRNAWTRTRTGTGTRTPIADRSHLAKTRDEAGPFILEEATETDYLSLPSEKTEAKVEVDDETLCYDDMDDTLGCAASIRDLSSPVTAPALHSKHRWKSRSISFDNVLMSASWSTLSGTSVSRADFQSVNVLKSEDSGLVVQTGAPDPGPVQNRSLSLPSLTQRTAANLQAASSLLDMRLNCSCEEFTPDVIDEDEEDDDESYRFRCSSPGLFRCSVTGLVFHMEGGGEVLYAVLPWNRRLLSRNKKKPAGPLFDVKCPQQTVRQLHLPHCEVPSTGGAGFLAVAHVTEDGVEFIQPQRVTETHVIVNITGCSGFGNVKDEDAPPDLVQALVLLFYRPPRDPHLEHLINVLMLPKNVSLRDVLRTRRKFVGDETYMETNPHCKLQPRQVYSLSTCPGDDSVLVQPPQAEFDEESYDNFFPSFQVTYEAAMTHMKLFLRDSSSQSVWESRVCLSTSRRQRSCGSTGESLRPDEQLLEIRSQFVDGVSGPVLQSLLDKLLEKQVMSDSEREAAEEKRSRGDKARFVLDTVRRKGQAASSEMMEFLREVDPFLCDHLGLM